MNNNNIFLKLLLGIFLSLFLLNSSFAGNVTYTDSAFSFYADMWNTRGFDPIWDTHIFLSSFIVKSQLSTGLTNTINYTNSPTIEYTQVLLYPETTEDYTLKHQAIDLNTSDSGTFAISQKKYRTPGDTIVHLSSTSCNINNLAFDTSSDTLTVTSNLNPFQVYDWNTGTGQFELKTADFSNSNTTYFTDLLNRYYNMKSTVVGKIYFNNTLIETIYEDNMTSVSTLQNTNGDNYINYSYIKPLSTTTLNFSNKADYLRLLQTYNNYGIYTFEFTVTPIDFKCDLDSSNSLTSSEFNARAENFTLQIRVPNTPTISSPTDSSNFQGGKVNVTTTVSDPDGNDLTVYFLVDNTIFQTQSNVASSDTITSELTGLTDGFHNLSVIVSDLYTNISSSNNVSILMETPPVGTTFSVSSGNSVSYDKNRTYTFSSIWTDFNGIDEVIFNFDGINYSSISNISSNYSINFSDLSARNYSYQWFGNDTQGSDNESAVFNLEITKTTPTFTLELNNLSNNITTEVNTNVSINATETITDNANISLLENGNLINLGTGSLINTTSYSLFNQTNNITLSYSESQNYTSRNLTFTIITIDTINPQVTNLIPNNTTFNIGNTIEISANATDNYELSSVIAQINLPNGTITNLTLINQTFNKYNASFIIPNLVGVFNITFIANDHIGNLNNTEISNFSTLDVTAPTVNIVNPSINDLYNTSDVIEISANVTDEISITSVIAQIDYPNSTSLNITLSNALGAKYNNSFTVPQNLLGLFNITIIATDSSNNINSSEKTNFTVFDNIVPTIILNNPDNLTDYNIGDTIIINSTVTDNIEIANVYATISYPNSNIVNLTLFNSSSDIFNNTFNLAITGIYNITIFANDSSNNINNTQTLSFNVSDFTNPNVTALIPLNGTNYNLTEVIEVSANVSDLSSISYVIAQIDYPNSTSVNLTLTNVIGDKYNNSFVVPNVIGRFNITFLANDSFNNINNSEISYFNVLDNINPNVTVLIPTINSIFNTSESIEISANVTDEIQVSNVIAQIDYPNSTSINITLANSIGSIYNNSFVIPTNLIGLFNITIIGTDSSNNINNTEKTNFTVNDNINPSLTIITPTNSSTLNYSDVLILNSTITDNILIDTVYANVTLPNSSINTITLINFNNTNLYNATFTPNTIGNYSVVFFVNDSSSNENISNNILFSYIDNTNPEVLNTTPINNQNFNLSDIVEISSNVTDDISVSSVYVTIDYPNSTSINITLTNVIGDKYNNSFVVPSNLIGKYNITYIANDTTNNINNSVATSFNVLDNINPNVTALLPINSSIFNITDSIEISANVTDEISVSNVIAQIDYPNSTSINLTLINTIGNKYNTSFTIPELLGRYNITIIATDSSNNINNTEKTNFEVIDSFNPNVVIVNPTANSTSSSGSSIEISSNVTDSITVSNVIAQIDYPNSTSINLTLINVIGDKYNTSFSIPELLGKYNITIFANDSSSNINNSETTFFNVVDTTKPIVNLSSPNLNSNFNVTNNVIFEVNTTDNIAIDSVIAQLSMPNSTSYNLTLTSVNNVTYNITYSIPNVIGLYNLTFIVNDSTGNINNSVTSNFTVNDNINPNVTLVSPSLSSVLNVLNNVTFSVNSSDNIALNSVIAQLSMPNGTNINYTLTSTNNITYNITYSIPNVIGLYNLTFIAIDSSNNINNSVTSNFTVNDNINPASTLINPQINSNNTIGSNLIISINATDNILVDTVYTTISYPNSSMYNLTLDSTNNITYNNTFSIPNLLGLYNLTFTINDSSNNINNSITSNFTIFDNINPNVTVLIPLNGTSYNITESIEISTNVSDEIAVSNVIAQINYPNSTSVNLTLANTIGDKYNNSFVVPTVIGRYNITIIANDSSNNINSSETTYFNAIDLNNPNVTLVSNENGTNISIDSSVLLSVNVSDDIQVSSVYTTINYPNSTSINLTLNNVNNSNNYNNTFVVPKLLGLYNLTYTAVDSSDNINSSIVTFFNAIDNTNPNVTSLIPVNGTTFNVSDSIEISSTVFDDLLVDSVLVNISYPNGTINLFTLVNQTGNKYNTSFVIPNIIGRYNITIIANDSTNNTNNSQTTYFNAIDLVSPVMTSFSPISNTSIRANSVFNLTLNISDNVELSNVFATIFYPNSTRINLTLNNNIGNNFTNSFSVNNLTGRYNVTFTSNDTSNNVLTNDTFFMVTLPNILSSSISKSAVANSSTNSFFISAENFDELYANVTLPDLNVTQISLTNGVDTTFSNVSQIGNYSVLLVAKDSSNNIATKSHTFEVFNTVTFTSNVTGFNGTVLNGTFQIIFNNSVLQNGSLSSGNLSQTTISTPVTLLYKLFNNKISIKFNNINLTQNTGKYFYSDNYDNKNGFLTVLGVNTTYNFTNATVTLTYNDSGVTTETNLKLFYCSSYNFEARNCTSSFVDITSSGTLDTTSNTYTFTATGFSAYAVKEVTPTPTPSGGGGGGSSSSRSTTTTISPSTQEPTIATNETCTYNWVCSEWSNICPVSGIQTRTCSNIGTCSGNDEKPSQERTCSTYLGKEISMIKQAFHKIGTGVDDISIELDISEIVSENNLSINDTITAIYQLVDSNKEIALEEIANEIVNENNTINRNINTRNLNEGNYEFKITLIANDNRYLDFKQVIVDNKELYVEPQNESISSLSGNFLQDRKLSVIGLIVGVLLIAVVIVSVKSFSIESGRLVKRKTEKPKAKRNKIKKI